MSPTERPLESATYDHVALSVRDLDRMVAFYARLGFDEVAHVKFATAPVRLVTVANRGGASIELTWNADSAGAETPDAGTLDPISASRRRGPFHFAVRVTGIAGAVAAAEAAGARVVVPPRLSSNGTVHYAYLADPEGNLMELLE